MKQDEEGRKLTRARKQVRSNDDETRGTRAVLHLKDLLECCLAEIAFGLLEDSDGAKVSTTD